MKALMTLVTVGALALPGLLGAQVCIGNPSISEAGAILGAGVGFFDGGKRYSAGAIVGSAFFGGGSFGYTDFDDSDLSLKEVGADIGFELPLQSQASVCLGVSGSYGFGLEVLGVDITTLTIGPVLAAGVQAPVSPTVSVIPYAQLGWFYDRATADAGPLGEQTETDDHGALGLGVSLVFNRVLSVGPVVGIPLGVEGGNAVFGVGLSVIIAPMF